MKITWLGHASFRIEIENAVLLVDPWLEGNPSFPNEARGAALVGATHILPEEDQVRPDRADRLEERFDCSGLVKDLSS